MAHDGGDLEQLMTDLITCLTELGIISHNRMPPGVRNILSQNEHNGDLEHLLSGVSLE